MIILEEFRSLIAELTKQRKPDSTGFFVLNKEIPLNQS